MNLINYTQPAYKQTLYKGNLMYNHQEYIERNRRQPAPKFKVGDWVMRVLPDTTIHREENCNLVISATKDTVTIQLGSGSFIEYKPHHLRLWKPKPGEWIWVWNSFNSHPMLRKLLTVHQETGFEVEPTVGFAHKHIYSYAQPFIGTLPEQLKDK